MKFLSRRNPQALYTQMDLKCQFTCAIFLYAEEHEMT